MRSIEVVNMIYASQMKLSALTAKKKSFPKLKFGVEHTSIGAFKAVISKQLFWKLTDQTAQQLFVSHSCELKTDSWIYH